MDNRNIIHQAILELCEEVEQILTKRIAQYGRNRKGVNTLQGSNLEKSIEVIPQEDGLALQIADYWVYVASGWRRTHRSNATFTEYLMNIRDWIRRKNIKWGNMTENEMMWALAKRMFSEKEPYKIPARPFMRLDSEGDLTKMIPQIKPYMDKWFDTLFEAIIKDLEKYFNE